MVRGWFWLIIFKRLVDALFVHEIGSHEPYEGERACHGLPRGLGEAQQHESDEGDGDLNADGVSGGAAEAGGF
jgi:hypothetical protein